ncbi:uncharacterized protein RCO7_11461 [Rhynchosporium graminicola]|uniref:Uncharacterized protein n=1 Tax=Rhynchosporium graminicola TaxID=2792576 RepID=A0A1E1LN88_9HELO|nr:uncharacterized protein RCO7_11461 [Rhynchosporium commune]
MFVIFEDTMKAIEPRVEEMVLDQHSKQPAEAWVYIHSSATLSVHILSFSGTGKEEETISRPMDQKPDKFNLLNGRSNHKLGPGEGRSVIQEVLSSGREPSRGESK